MHPLPPRNLRLIPRHLRFVPRCRQLHLSAARNTLHRRHSSGAALVCMLLPPPPADGGAAYVELLHTLTDGLPPTVLCKSGGDPVMTFEI